MRLRDLLILTLFLALFFGILLGSRPLSVPDEGRYVEIPREMVVSHDWLTPRLNSVKYFEKPPLFYWIEAMLIRLFGLSEWSVRLGPALLALFGCLAVFFAGSRMFGRLTGIFSAIILATSMLYFALSRLITLDMPVSVLLTAALLSFLAATREPAGRTRVLFFRGFYAFAGLAVLTKGLIGIVFPGMIIFSWMLVTGEWRLLRSMHLLSGSVIFFAIAAPWHILVGRANPEFFDFYFVREHFQRYLTKVHHHYKPFWFFIPVVLGGLFPWSAFLVQAVRDALPATWKDRRQHKETLFLLLWAALIFLFFSASSSKLIPYILPVLPPLALLIGKYLADAVERGRTGLRAGFNAFLVMSALIAVVLGALPFRRPDVAPSEIAPYLMIMIAVLASGAFGAWYLWKNRRLLPALAATAATAVLFMTTVSAAVPQVNAKSNKSLALEIRKRLGPDDEIVHYRNYYQDLPVYLERRMTIVDWRGELDFGMAIENTSGWMIDEAELWKRWQGPRRIFLAAGTRDADAIRQIPGKLFFLIAQNKNTVILSNKEDQQ
ncbi:MAG: glycosyltransferase family 39 protein [Nitrospirota bacterium]|nr:glycosyltransferase family 39 protein [Nitrospirota bacterium]